MTKKISRMKILLLIALFFIFFRANCFAEQLMLIDAGERKLIGNPKTLLVIRDIQVGQHEIMMSRWQAEQGIQAVMPILLTQLPTDTIAWSNGEVMQMQWESSIFSHVLAVHPLGRDQVSFTLTSLRLHTGQQPSRANQLKIDSSLKQSLSTYLAIKSLLAEPSLKNQLILDVNNPGEASTVTSLLYVSSHPIFYLKKLLRNTLSSQRWTLTDSFSSSDQSLRGAVSIEAYFQKALIRIDLVEHAGRTFLYLYLTASTS